MAGILLKGMRKAAKAAGNPFTDLAAYPILTEEVGYPPSPVGAPAGTGGGAGNGATAPLGQIVNKAVSEILGWKIKPGDSSGFIAALNQSFTLTEVEGHVESKWVPRTYAAQTDLSGGITGAQASVYARGKEALDQSLPLLDGLYTLDPEADAEDVIALKAVVKSQLTELVNELGFISGPRIARVNQYFSLLLVDSGAPQFPSLPSVDPDKINGTLGNLRDVLGLNFDTQDFVNSVEDEQNLSNFRILSDYVTSLAQSWINNLPFLGLNSAKPFFGTQLILLSRQLSVVAESVDEVRFTLDSVFIGPAERQTIKVNYPGVSTLKSIFLEDLFSWISNFSTEEGPRLIQDGGKFGVQNTFTPVVRELLSFVVNLPKSPGVTNPMPAGFFAPRVQLAVDDLVAQLQSLVTLAAPIKHEITSEPDFGLPFQVATVEPLFLSDLPPGSTAMSIPVHVRGNGFQATPTVLFQGHRAPIVKKVYFRSETLLIVALDRSSVKIGTSDVVVMNADGQTLTLSAGFTVGP
ncbi:MAG TPA: hypothetical protein VFK06_24025 [Candidatus Angelobacter sp.]|nr:hypothetical protein [Candidatus Angelobacter sp.]